MTINTAANPCVRLTLTMDKCPLRFGVAPCGAVFNGVVGKCYNTFGTCQSRPDYVKAETGRVYRFASEGVFLDGYVGWIKSYAIASPAIKSDFKAWKRERITIRLADTPGPDATNDDDYQTERGAGGVGGSPAVNNASSWWSRFLARNEYFNRRPALFEVGYIDDNNEFIVYSEHHLFIDNLMRDSKGGGVVIELTDGIKIKKSDGAVIPKVSDITLTADLNENDDIFTVAKNLQGRFDGIQHICVGGEIMEIIGISDLPDDTTQFFVRRAAGGSEAKDHDDGDTLTPCYTVSERNVVDIVRDLLTDFCDLGDVEIDDESFDSEKNGFLETYRFTTIIAKPEDCEKILQELQQSGLFNVWYDSGTQRIKMRSVVNLSLITDTLPPITDDNITERSLSISSDPRKTVSRVFISTRPVSYADTTADEDRWRNLNLIVNGTVENPNARGEAVAQVFYSRFLSPTLADQIGGRLIRTGALADGKITLEMPITDGTRKLEIGQNIPLMSWQWTDANGNPQEYVFRILQITAKNAETLAVRGVRTIYGGNGIRPFIWGRSHWGDGGVWI